MYRSTLRPPSCRQSKLLCYFCHIHVRRLANAGSVPVVNSDQHSIEYSEPWQENVAVSLAKIKKVPEDILVDDLDATLEAHRASDRPTFIREVESVPSYDLKPKRPLRLKQGSDGDGAAKKVHEEIDKKKEGPQNPMWPLDSVQAKARYGEKDCKTYYKKRAALEYTSAVAWCQGPWKQTHSFHKVQDTPMKRPWLAYMRTTGEDSLERLTNEIKAYEAYMMLSPREEAASELVISDVQSVAQNGKEMQPLTLLGSRSTGLAIPTSDFDFSSTLPDDLLRRRMALKREDGSAQSLHKSKAKAVKILKRMKDRFRSSKEFRNVELIRHARVPILRCTHVATRLDVQIQTMAPYQAANKYKLASLSKLPSLRPLYIILRSFLELRNLTTVFEGGLGSYTIFMMIVTALKRSSGRFASDDLGSQLMHVLEFWGNADLYKNGFSANPPYTFEKRRGPTLDMIRTLDPRKPYLLCLQDPADGTNDLGKNAYAIKHIQATFRYEEHNLRNQCSQEPGLMDSYLGFLEADYRHFESSRSRVEGYADPTELHDRNYSPGRVLRDYRKRVEKHKTVAEEDNHPPKPTSETEDENVAESIKSADGVNGATTVPQSSQRPAGTLPNRSKLRFVVADPKQMQSPNQHETNDG